MGDAGGVNSAGSSGNVTDNDPHREPTGNGSTVGSVADIRSVLRREGLQRGRSHEGCIVVSRGADNQLQATFVEAWEEKLGGYRERGSHVVRTRGC